MRIIFFPAAFAGCLKIEIKSLRIEYLDLLSDRSPNKERVKLHCDTPSSYQGKLHQVAVGGCLTIPGISLLGSESDVITPG